MGGGDASAALGHRTGYLVGELYNAHNAGNAFTDGCGYRAADSLTHHDHDARPCAHRDAYGCVTHTRLTTHRDAPRDIHSDA